MEWRDDSGAGIAASAIAHLSVAVLLILLGEVHPFGKASTEPIEVELVTAVEADRKVEPTPTPAPVPQLPLPDKPAAAPVTADQPKQAAPQAAPPEPPPRSASAPPEKPSPQAARRTPGPPPRTAPAAPASPALGYTPPEPDLTVKYHVLLGLPGELPPPSPSSSSPADKPGDGIDATASTAADVDSSLKAQFRQRLKTCSKLPATIAPSDNVMIKLRVSMAPDGTLAAEPILIEATASEKGPLLMQAAVSALQACQPYAMLPKDRYGEWKVIDLPFTPQDFTG
ncbi:MAG TPA: hypothetical protein VMM15_40365 [Bradyrhizobium sp.]|nr:hypothetical protein [Bradyrhizobium sp.]